MTHPNRLRTLLFTALAFTFAGCSVLQPRPDPTRYYVLNPAATTPPATAGAQLSVGLGPITLPAYLDRPEMVTRVERNRVVVSEYERWAAPLSTSFANVLAQDIGALLPNCRIVRYPWYRSSRPDYRVEIQVIRFEADAQGNAHLVARWTLEPSDGRAAVTKEAELSRAPSAAGTEAMVAALNETLMNLAREIAAALQAADLEPAKGGMPAEDAR